MLYSIFIATFTFKSTIYVGLKIKYTHFTNEDTGQNCENSIAGWWQ